MERVSVLRWSELDSLDRRLILALQARPMLSWSALASVLRTDRATPKRRWAHLREEYAARIAIENDPGATYLRPQRLLRMDVRPGAQEAVSNRLLALPFIRTVLLATGPEDLIAYITEGEDRLDFRSLHRALGQIDGITAVRVTQVTKTLRRASQHQVRPATDEETAVVARAHEAQLRENVAPGLGGASESMSSLVRDVLLRELRIDARVGVAALNSVENVARAAARLPRVTPSTTSRERAALLADPANRVRLWLPTRAAAAPIHMLWVQMSPGAIGRIGAFLTEIGEHVLWAGESTGSHNVVFTANFDGAAALQQCTVRLHALGASDVRVERVYAGVHGRNPDLPLFSEIWAL